MLKRETVFDCGNGLTPDVAARLTQVAERYKARLELECGGKRVLLDSLIGILSLECDRGTPVTIYADGADEADAVQAVATILETKGC